MSYLGIFWFRMSISTNKKEMPMMNRTVMIKIRIVIVWLRRQIPLDFFSLWCESLRETTKVGRQEAVKWDQSMIVRVENLVTCEVGCCVRAGYWNIIYFLILSSTNSRNNLVVGSDVSNILKHFRSKLEDRIIVGFIANDVDVVGVEIWFEDNVWVAFAVLKRWRQLCRLTRFGCFIKVFQIFDAQQQWIDTLITRRLAN